MSSLEHLNRVERRMMPGSFASNIMGNRPAGSMPLPVSHPTSRFVFSTSLSSWQPPTYLFQSLWWDLGLPPHRKASSRVGKSSKGEETGVHHQRRPPAGRPSGSAKVGEGDERKGKSVQFKGVDSFGRSNTGLHRPFHTRPGNHAPRKEDMNS